MKIFLLVGFLLLINISLSAQKKEVVKNAIRIKVETINKGKNYKAVDLGQEEFMDHVTDRGGSLTGYFKNGKLVKIASWIGLSNYYAVDEYFLDNDKLIFVNEKENQFEFSDSTGEESKTTVRFDGRYWFNKNKKIDEISTGHNRFEADEIDSEKEFLADVKKYIPLLYKKYKTRKK